MVLINAERATDICTTIPVLAVVIPAPHDGTAAVGPTPADLPEADAAF